MKLRNRYLPGGAVRWWSCYLQGWQQAVRVPDRELATMTAPVRRRVLKHTHQVPDTECRECGAEFPAPPVGQCPKCGSRYLRRIP